MRGGGEDGDGVVVKMVMGWGKGLRLSFECSKGRRDGATKIEQV